MMTLDEIGALPIGAQVQMPNGTVATVITVNSTNKLIALSMLGGSTTTIEGEVPPDRVDAETTVICAWADLVNATKVVP
jgi:phosphoribosylcarboxyaminoimidazole (NCAIR) mutase